MTKADNYFGTFNSSFLVYQAVILNKEQLELWENCIGMSINEKEQFDSETEVFMTMQVNLPDYVQIYGTMCTHTSFEHALKLCLQRHPKLIDDEYIVLF